MPFQWIRHVKKGRKKNWAHYPAFLGAPSILISVAWFAIWLVWPSRTPTVTRRSHYHSNRVLYAPFHITEQVPMLPCPPAELAEDTDENRASSLVNYWASHDRSLPRSAATNAFPLLPLPSPPHHPLRTVTGRYSSVFTRHRPSPGPVPAELSILVETTGDLKRHGFAATDIASANLLQSGKPWQASLYVEIDASGRPSNVFLESSTGDSNLDAALITTLYGGRLSSKPVPCRGRVTVSAGKR